MHNGIHFEKLQIIRVVLGGLFSHVHGGFNSFRYVFIPLRLITGFGEDFEEVSLNVEKVLESTLGHKCNF